MTGAGQHPALFLLALKTPALLGYPPAEPAMEGMVLDPSCARDRPPAARKRLSSSVASEAADSESDVKSDDSEAFIPAKHRRSRRKSSTSSSSEETVIYSNIVITTVAYVPVDVSVSLNAISKQKLHDFFFNLAPGLIQEVRVNPRKNIIAVDTTDEKTFDISVP
ncbi:hypothetical protein HPB52_024775 [Rhipicephalus sanguineus]|uniref:Uncharacterized protein n=1 Tax=Rhipicephalus sanguineus TaxID=34632 RepID=A0A9D4YRR0_RHISA|nr:hypothetical protein HPB52_024775 [Rhipicephalus sanguineus]